MSELPSFLKLENSLAMHETRVWSLNWKIPGNKEWQPTPVFLPGEFHGQRSVAGYSPWDCQKLDTTERLTLKAEKHSIVCIYNILFIHSVIDI